MICRACNASLPEKAKFCISCGAGVTLVCPFCCSAVDEEQRFCAGCGHRLSEEAIAPKTGPLRDGEDGDRRVVTVLFTDVSGFTAMSEKLDPEEVTEIVNQFFQVLSQPIYKYGVVVDKYMGDAIMALFGAPVAHDDDPLRAVSAAWAMQRTAREFSDRTGIPLKIRIGLNTGLVVAGAVGGHQKQDYTVMGDTVNLAQRMESNAEAGGILVSHETFKLTNLSFEYQERSPLKVKGKEGLVKAYDLQGPRHKQTSGSKPPFVGRAAELGRLKLSLDSAIRHPQLVVISGLSPRQKRSAAYLVLNDLLALMMKKNPLVLFLHDLHWIDEASLEWLHSLVDRLAADTLPVMLILQHRPTTLRNLSEWSDRIDLTRLRLRPLSGEEAASLAGGILRIELSDWPPALRQLVGKVHARSEGNPLYLTEMLHSLLAAKVIVREEGKVIVHPLRAGQALPTTINGVVASRQDVLKPHQHSLLQVASVIGRAFHPRFVQKIYPVSNLEESLFELVRSEFIQPREGGEYLFNQAVVQEVAYQSLLLSSRRRLHQLLALSIEEALGERKEEQTKNRLQVGVIKRLKATHAISRGKPDEAEKMIREALEILETSGSKLELARTRWTAWLILREDKEAHRNEALAVFRQLNARLDLDQALNEAARKENRR